MNTKPHFKFLCAALVVFGLSVLVMLAPVFDRPSGSSSSSSSGIASSGGGGTNNSFTNASFWLTTKFKFDATTSMDATYDGSRLRFNDGGGEFGFGGGDAFGVGFYAGTHGLNDTSLSNSMAYWNSAGRLISVLLTNTIGITFDGGGAAIATNITRYLVVPYNCTVVGFTMVSDITTISVVDVMRTTYALYDAGSTHPVIGDAITAALPPTIGPSLYKTNVTSVATWSSSLTNGNIVAFRLITNTAATTLHLALSVSHAP